MSASASGSPAKQKGWKVIAAYLSPSKRVKTPKIKKSSTSSTSTSSSNNKKSSIASLPTIPALDDDDFDSADAIRSSSSKPQEEEGAEDEHKMRIARTEPETPRTAAKKKKIKRKTRKSSSSSTLKKSVSFDSGVLVYMDTSRHKDRQAMFYSREEMEEFQNDVVYHQEIIMEGSNFDHNEALSPEQKHRFHDETDMNDDDIRCLLGVEHHFLNGTYKQKQKLKAVLAVLMEQDRQFKEEGHFTPVDDERMSTCYQRVSKTSHQEAHERGLKYFAGATLPEEIHEDEAEEQPKATTDDATGTTAVTAVTAAATTTTTAAAAAEPMQLSASSSVFSPEPASPPPSFRKSISSFSSKLAQSIGTPKLMSPRKFIMKNRAKHGGE